MRLHGTTREGPASQTLTGQQPGRGQELRRTLRHQLYFPFVSIIIVIIYPAHCLLLASWLRGLMYIHMLYVAHAAVLGWDGMGRKGRIFIECFIFFIYASVFCFSLLTAQHTTCVFKSFFFWLFRPESMSPCNFIGAGIYRVTKLLKKYHLFFFWHFWFLFHIDMNSLFLLICWGKVRWTRRNRLWDKRKA